MVRRAPAPVAILPLTPPVDPAAETDDAREDRTDEIIVLPEADPPVGATGAGDLGRVTPRSAGDLETSEWDRHAHKR